MEDNILCDGNYGVGHMARNGNIAYGTRAKPGNQLVIDKVAATFK